MALGSMCQHESKKMWELVEGAFQGARLLKLIETNCQHVNRSSQGKSRESNCHSLVGFCSLLSNFISWLVQQLQEQHIVMSSLC